MDRWMDRQTDVWMEMDGQMDRQREKEGERERKRKREREREKERERESKITCFSSLGGMPLKRLYIWRCSLAVNSS